MVRLASDGAGTTDPARWCFRAALARVEPDVRAILAEHASSYWRRALSQRELEAAHAEVRLLWMIDGEPVLEFRYEHRRPATLVVHDFALYEPLRKAVRTRHVRMRFATVDDARSVGV
jgi:hypothetical protein